MSGSRRTLSRFDVGVIGGGPAGLATAIALRREGLAVFVVERTDYRSQRIGEHIPPTTKARLISLGLSDILASGKHASCPCIRSSWGSDEPADRDYLFHPNGEGLNLSRPDFDLSLAGLAKRLGATVITEARIVALSRLANSWQLLVSHATGSVNASAAVLVDATGRAASIAKRMGARPVVYDELVGVVGRLPGTAPSNHIVIVEAVKQGWWYSAGLADGSVVATFMSDAKLVDTSKAGRTRAWRDWLKGAPMTASRLVDHEGLIDLHIRTARTQRLDLPIGDHWLAVGDAAMSFDPLSSEGITKGLVAGSKAAVAVAGLCGGDRSMAQGYCDEIRKEFARYLATRHSHYAAEGRWPDAPFWRRRQLSTGRDGL